DVVPGGGVWRGPADATFVLVALVALIAGYLVHRWLTDTVAPAGRVQRACEIACPVVLVAGALALANSVVGFAPAIVPVISAVVFTAAGVAVLFFRPPVNSAPPVSPPGLLARF